MPDSIRYQQLNDTLRSHNVQLIAVSKTKSVAEIKALYELGQRDFGENYAQELVEKAPQLPDDIRWHFIGHLQKNKVKYIIPFVHLIHSVDSYELLAEIEKRAAKESRIIQVLLELKVAEEENKHGLTEHQLIRLLDQWTAQEADFAHIQIAGLMAMASLTEDQAQLATEFTRARTAFEHFRNTSFFAKPAFTILSMGMSSDYELAIANGSTMVRIGSLLFGARTLRNA
ncbi:MAG: YggS family pyridoxal phosphate-dependent enzyme [Sphingobacteriales bacterium]|nr:MAG: YggS family pyridoxal phosphate-dependent enzyme [Sphingobacteriales bacterium]